MNPGDFPSDLFRTLEGAVAFRLFADQVDPTTKTSPPGPIASAPNCSRPEPPR